MRSKSIALASALAFLLVTAGSASALGALDAVRDSVDRLPSRATGPVDDGRDAADGCARAAGAACVERGASGLAGRVTHVLEPIGTWLADAVGDPDGEAEESLGRAGAAAASWATWLQARLPIVGEG